MNETEKKVIIDREKCKGCRLCVNVCPVNIIKMSDKINSHGYHPAEIIKQEKCISCASCAIICPDVAVKVFK